MYIIDKNKDYYDYLSSPNMYGTDKKVVYDRRGSVILTDEYLVNMVYSSMDSFRKMSYFLLLEVGYKQHIIEITNIKFRSQVGCYSNFISCNFKKVYTFNNSKPTHLYPEYPISIREVELDYVGGNKGREFKYTFDKTNTYRFSDIVRKESSSNVITNPILKETSLTSLFTAEDIWIELQTYISSLNNDEDRETDLTDVERAEKNGFDRKTSFRNPIK